MDEIAKKHHHLGLCLSGGGAKGIAHIGVLKALEENNIFPEVISGSSFGAVVGAAYANGVSVDDIYKVCSDLNLYKLLKFSWPMKLQGDMKFLQSALEKFIPHNSFEELKKPLFVSISNLSLGRSEIISSGPLHDIIMASASFPAVFPSKNLNNNIYLDGGILCNLPVKPLRKCCNVVLGVNLHPFYETSPSDTPYDSITSVFNRILDLYFNENTKHDASLCDVLIEPEGIDKIGIFGFSNINQIFEIGYNATIKNIYKIKEVLEYSNLN